MPSAPSITFEVRPSRLLARAVIVMTVLALVAVVLSGWPWYLKACLAGAVTASIWRTLRWLHTPALRTVGWHEDDTWTLHFVDGRQCSGRLRQGRVLGPLITLSLMASRGDKLTLALLPDNLDADTRRRLRMRLSVAADMA